MKKFILLFLMVFSVQFATTAYALDTANIRFNLSGTSHDNRYFLCIPNIGCLSVLAGDRGKVYPIIYPFKINNIYLSDLDNHRIYYEGLPQSCSATIELKHTVTIHGHISPDSNVIDNMYCTIR